jgi:hypothetical protein
MVTNKLTDPNYYFGSFKKTGYLFIYVPANYNYVLLHLYVIVRFAEARYQFRYSLEDKGHSGIPEY